MANVETVEDITTRIEQSQSDLLELRRDLLRLGMPRYKTYSWYLLAYIDEARRGLSKAQETIPRAVAQAETDRMPRAMNGTDCRE